MNTWESLKSEAWRIFRKLTWYNIKFDNLKDWLVHKTIKYRELESEYAHREIPSIGYFINLLADNYSYKELME